MEQLALQPLLPAAGVEVWRCRISARPLVDEQRAYEHLACLSPPEHARAARIIDVQTRRLFLAAALMKRQVLARSVGLSPSALHFGAAPHGKPFLTPSQNPLDLRFNLSHSGEVALLAITRGRDVGIDIERLRPLEWRGVAAQVYSPAERQMLEAQLEARQPAAFFQLWTAKEAYLKALGCGLFGGGLSLPPESVSLAFREADIQIVQAAAQDGSAWQGRLFHVQDGYQAALVVQATPHPLEIRLHDWEPDFLRSPFAPVQAACLTT